MRHLSPAVKRGFLSALLLGLGAAVFLWLSMQSQPPPPPAVDEKTWVVTVQEVTRQTMRPSLRLYGVVESPRKTDLSAAVSAEVRAVNVLAGEAVSAGQVLVALDDDDLRLQLRQREADVAEAEANLAYEKIRRVADKESLMRETTLYELAEKSTKRLQRLVQRGSGTETGLDQSRSELQQAGLRLVARQLAVEGHETRLAMLTAQKDRAEALRDQALLNLKRATVRAPLEGRATAVHVSAGGRVVPGDVLVTVFDDSLVEVRAQIPERDLPRVRTILADGGKIAGEAQVDGARLRLSLHRLAADIQPGKGGVDALFRLQDGFVPELGRVVELFAHLASQPQVVAVPRQALYGQNKVFTVADGKLKAVRVSVIGRTFGDTGSGDFSAIGGQVLVRSPQLADGDLLVISALPNAVDGLPVRVGNAGAQ